MRRYAAVFAGLLAWPAHADVAEAVKDVILPGYADFAEKAAALAAVDCTDQANLRFAWNAAFDAWLAVAHFRMGPSEVDGRALAIAFWPDPKGLGAKAQVGLMKADDPALGDPVKFAEVSVAARGLFGLEQLLYPSEPEFEGPSACALIAATSGDLALMATDLQAGWIGGYADHLLAPGGAGNSDFLTENEARQAMLTALVTGIEFNANQRLARPLGDFDKPRPERAEARASGRSQQNVIVSLNALHRLSNALVALSPQTDAAFQRALAQAAELEDPVFAGVTDTQKRLKIEIVQQSIHAIEDAVMVEMVPALGVGLGFNAADGD
jgi:uncharacterized protein